MILPDKVNAVPEFKVNGEPRAAVIASCGANRCSYAVSHDGIVRVSDAAGLLGATTPVEVFKIKEILLVHRADFIQTVSGDIN